jgi:hypothetical protein
MYIIILIILKLKCNSLDLEFDCQILFFDGISDTKKNIFNIRNKLTKKSYRSTF